MARKGSRKVRTGCITCKIRRVKCDETKPDCKRCTISGRVCDGYVPVLGSLPEPKSQGHLSLYRPHHVFPGAETSIDGRALQYFCEIAGPVMSGAANPYFWTHLVLQFSTFEPAVKHAVIAISNLYEQNQEQPDVGSVVRTKYRNQALQHYNTAIRELNAKSMQDKPHLVLLVCVLFICIESLRSDREAAVRHCRHGIEILSNTGPEHSHSWISDYLVPIFRRMNEFAFFFCDDKYDFPDVPDFSAPVSHSFSTIDDATRMMDDIYNQMVHLMRYNPEAEGVMPRLSDPSQPSSMGASEYLANRATTSRLLEQWLGLFADFNNRVPYSKTSQDESTSMQKMTRVFLLTRYEACRCWVDMIFVPDVDAARDGFLGNFQRVLKQLLWLESQMPESVRANGLQSPPQFMFEKGFNGYIFFFVSTCRDLDTRLELLRLMQLFGLPKENLWEQEVLVAAGRKIIEDEHGVRLDASGRLITDEIGTPDSPTDSPPPDHVSSSFIYKRALQAHPWCSMPASFNWN